MANVVLRIDALGVTLATSAATGILLKASPTHTTLSSVGMLLTTPYRDLHPGETHQDSVVTYGIKGLNIWNCDISNTCI